MQKYHASVRKYIYVLLLSNFGDKKPRAGSHFAETACRQQCLIPSTDWLKRLQTEQQYADDQKHQSSYIDVSS